MNSPSSQPSTHTEKIFRLLLKISVYGWVALFEILLIYLRTDPFGVGQ